MAILQGNAKQGSVRGFYPKTIEGSLRFNDDDGAYLIWTPASAGNRKTWTWSGWVKRTNLGTFPDLFSAGGDGVEFYFADESLQFYYYSGGYVAQIKTTQVLRDASSWYHIVASIDTTQATSSDRIKLYINGSLVTSLSVTTYPPQNTDMDVSNTTAHYIGRYGTGGSTVRNGEYYLAEVHFTDGTAYTADAFGELKNGVWVAKTPDVTYGTNGFYLDFANSADIGNDVSGEGNDWTPNNFTASDVVLDSPTDNYCTWNPIARQTGTVGTSNLPTFSDGNLTAASSANNSGAHGTFLLSSGQWYWEVTLNTNNVVEMGIAYDGSKTGYDAGVMYYRDGRKRIDGTLTSYGSSFTTGDVIGIALDTDANEVTFYKNNVSQGAISYTPLSTDPTPAIWMAGGTSTKVSANFGQLGFTYTPPTGYLALSTANLPNPAIDPAQGSSPEDYFGSLLWSGDDNATRTIQAGGSGVTGDVNFTPDFSWIKRRNGATNGSDHMLLDAVRGVGSFNALSSNGTQEEGRTEAGSFWINFGDIDSFTTDGFTVQKGSDPSHTLEGINQSGGTYVAWNWKANGSGVSNTDGSITSTVSTNTESGFSIVTYTGTGASATVGHGLTQAPELIIAKNRDDAVGWPVYSKEIGAGNYLLLHSTNASASGTGVWNNTSPTNSVFSVATGSNNTNTKNIIAYCFHSVEGFSKFGSYTGNGSADGPFVYTGFQVRFIIVKQADGTNHWKLLDMDRDLYNPVDNILYPSLSLAEGTADTNHSYDFVSNGFKVRTSHSSTNASGSTYIYMAFAENPFKYSNAR